MEPQKKLKQQDLPENRPLPYDQVSLERQFDILKAYVAYHQKEKKAAGYKEIAPLAKISATMVSGSLKFWASTGLLLQSDGKYSPSEKLIDLCNQLSWGTDEEALRVLREALADTWFVKHIEIAFSVHQSASYEEISNSIGAITGVPKTKLVEASLKRLIELLEKAEFIKKEDGLYSWIHPVKPIRKTIEVDDKKDLLTFIIDGDKFVITIKELKQFILNKGQKIDSKEHDLV